MEGSTQLNSYKNQRNSTSSSLLCLDGFVSHAALNINTSDCGSGSFSRQFTSLLLVCCVLLVMNELQGISVFKRAYAQFSLCTFFSWKRVHSVHQILKKIHEADNAKLLHVHPSWFYPLSIFRYQLNVDNSKIYIASLNRLWVLSLYFQMFTTYLCFLGPIAQAHLELLIKVKLMVFYLKSCLPIFHVGWCHQHSLSHSG